MRNVRRAVGRADSQPTVLIPTIPLLQEHKETLHASDVTVVAVV